MNISAHAQSTLALGLVALTLSRPILAQQPPPDAFAMSEVTKSLGVSYDEMVGLAAKWELGKLLFELDEYAAAAHALEPVVHAFPDDPKALALLGACYAMQEEWEKGEVVLLSAFEQNPQSVEMINLLADFYLQKGEDRRGFHLFEASLAMRPEQNTLRVQLLRDYHVKGLISEMQPHLDFFLKESTFRPASVFDYASKYHSRLGNFGESLLYSRLAYQSAPGNALYLKNLADSYLKVNQFQEAATCYRSYTRQQPLDPAGYILLGESHYRLLQWEEAEQVWIQALSLFPGNSELTGKIIELYIDTGRPEKARGKLEDLLAENGMTLQGRLVLIRYFRKMGSHDRALEIVKGIRNRDEKGKLAQLCLWEEAQVRFAMGEHLRVQRLTDPLLHSEQYASQALILKARSALAMKEQAEAQEWLLKAHRENPYDLRIYGMAFAVFAGPEDLKQLAGLLDVGIAAMPHSTQLQHQYASLLTRMVGNP